VAPVAEWLGELDADTLLAGHQPFLGRLTSLLLAGDPDGVSLGFAPGSVACLEAQPGGTWSLLWMVRPELLSAPGA
jgi:phosphohistidine phosphatase SixA